LKPCYAQSASLSAKRMAEYSGNAMSEFFERDFFIKADDVLRGNADTSSTAWQRWIGYSLLFGLLYGAAMGCFGGWGGERALQIVFSALKVPLLLQVTFILALPSFFVANTLMGVRDDFGLVLRALFETQAGVAIILASLAPLTLFFYASSSHYEAAVLFNFLMFSLATLCAQKLLRRRYRVLIERNVQHQKLLWGWIVLYGFVGVQMGWVLRPFVGAPEAPVRFFREGAWGNVYEVLFEMILKVLAP
jgi:hypothetical protein